MEGIIHLSKDIFISFDISFNGDESTFMLVENYGDEGIHIHDIVTLKSTWKAAMFRKNLK